MKKRTFCKILAFSILGFVILLKLGFFYIGIAPIFSYKINVAETKVLNDAMSKFRHQVENENFDEIVQVVAKSRNIEPQKVFFINEIKETRKKFGKPISSEFFRAMYPEPVSKFYPNLDGEFYTIFYFTKTENGEFFEHFNWSISENEEPYLINYSSSKMQTWMINNRLRDKFLNETFQNRILIHTGIFSSPIEIRY